jgi:small conductance mechanosensitive channel
VGGVTGEARSMNLVSTTIATQDNQLLVIPNNTVWQNIITNITGSDIRRVDMLFSIGYDDDIELAQEIMQAALNEHPGVLDDPEPTIAVQNLGAVSVDLICRPWARTEDYWNVYRELTRDVKERFQASGLKPPYLQANLQIPAPMPEAPQPPAYPVS